METLGGVRVLQRREVPGDRRWPKKSVQALETSKEGPEGIGENGSLGILVQLTDGTVQSEEFGSHAVISTQTSQRSSADIEEGAGRC